MSKAKRETFRGVWYRSQAPQERTLEDAFSRTRGKLTVEEKALRFEGGEKSFRINDIRQIDFGLQGSDPINSWIKVEHVKDGERKRAYFADGRFFGYGGFFGGTSRMLKSMDHLVDLPEIEDKSHVENKIRLVILLFIVLGLLYLNLQL